MSNIFPCIFGTTKGFEFVELAQLPFKMSDLLVAITHAEVALTLEDACIKLFRIKSGNVTYTWIGMYRKAYEMGFSREGGYYGAGVWLANTVVDSRSVLEVLEDLMLQIRRLALVDMKFQRSLSEIEPHLAASAALSALVSSKTPYLKGGVSAEAKLSAFICNPLSAREILAWAQTDPLAHHFQSVIIAPSSAFPKAGASGNMRQFADVSSLVKALEHDYTARLAKVDGLNKELQKQLHLLEAELAQQKHEVQSLTRKNAQLADTAGRSKVKTDYGGHSWYDFEYGYEDRLFSFQNMKQIILIAPMMLLLGFLLTAIPAYFVLYLPNIDLTKGLQAQRHKYQERTRQALEAQEASLMKRFKTADLQSQDQLGAEQDPASPSLSSSQAQFGTSQNVTDSDGPWASEQQQPNSIEKSGGGPSDKKEYQCYSAEGVHTEDHIQKEGRFILSQLKENQNFHIDDFDFNYFGSEINKDDLESILDVLVAKNCVKISDNYYSITEFGSIYLKSLENN